MRAFGAEHLHYGDPRGSSELRAAIADHLLSARGLRCDPEQIMLTTGTQHGLRIVLSAILKPGDRVWCEDPGYPAARNAIAHCGGRLVSVPVDQSGIVVAKGRATAPDARAAYVTPSHQFPLRDADVDAAPARAARLGQGTPTPSSWRTTTTASSDTTARRCCRSPASITCGA